MKSTPFLLALSLSLAACAKHLPDNGPVGAVEPRTSGAEVPVAPGAARQELRRNFERVSFDYDSAALDAASKGALARNADILREHPEIRIEVQGHCDERGTTEYNIALGDSRAHTVVSYLSAMGVGASRLEAVSYGEERPLARGQSEPIWSQNRRAEFRVSGDAEGVAGTTF